jgi:hypothetical protein
MESTRPIPGIKATVPVIQPPTWAVLQRKLFDTLDVAWRDFQDKYCGPDGRLRFEGRTAERDGADDFYEPFFNWPTLYLLGGSDDLLPAAKRHWEGVTRQLTERGFLVDEYERGYDWFHQGESLIFFYALCAADPADEAFRERALRFARLYLPGSAAGNYDSGKHIIVTPHNGAGGPRPGLGEDWQSYEAKQSGMRPYGLPLDDIDGIATWDDLALPGNARRMGQAMQDRMGAGDTAISLAATSLAANAWLYGNGPEFAAWIAEYVGAWRERALANGGLLPDNVGPGGGVGELHGGKWHGGHYGWSWPHGLHFVEPAALLAAAADYLVSGDDAAWAFARVPLETVIAHARRAVFNPGASTLGHWWQSRLGSDISREAELVPYRYSARGWFDWHPAPVTFYFWLWWNTGDDGDRELLERVLTGSGYDWRQVRQFRDKEDAGHEGAWYAWLCGQNPGFPEQSLRMALGQVSQRLALQRQDDGRTQGDDIHWWQQVNPVTTEVLSQQVLGAPATLYNGGLPIARLRYWDAERLRPGLPPEVCALVTRIAVAEVRVTLMNLDPRQARAVILQAGSWGEDRIDYAAYNELAGTWPGPVHGRSDITTPEATPRRIPVGASHLSLELPPLTQLRLTLEVTRRAYPARHQTFPSLMKGTR